MKDIEKMRRNKRHHKYLSSNNGKRGLQIRRWILILFILIGGAGAFGLGAYLAVRVDEHEQMRLLQQKVQESTDTWTQPQETVQPVTIPQQNTMPSETEAVTEPEERKVLSQYTQLHQENEDFIGWIRIDDTRIDYPVMQSRDEPERYLHADFEKNYSYAGLPFLDAKCSEDSDNMLIYAHNMLDGSMFRSLLSYEKKDYWEQHPVIRFDTLYEEQEYEVLAAFYDRVYYKTEDVFKFYQFIDAEDQEEYNAAVEQFKGKSLYDTGVEASYGDQLITLVTCAYHTENGRFVVVARKIPENRK